MRFRVRARARPRARRLPSGCPGLEPCILRSLLLSLAACGPVDAGLGPAGHASGWSDVACEAPAVLPGLPAPTPWIPDALPAFTAHLAWLEDSPYTAPGVPPADTRIGDLAVHDGRLVVGLGDWAINAGSLYCHGLGGACPHADAPGHGIPLLAIDAPDAPPVVLGVLEEEDLGRIRRTGLGLQLPSLDPSRGDGMPPCGRPDADPACPAEAGRRHPVFRVGNSTQLRDGALRSDPVIPDASHVFDVVPLEGALLAVGAGAPIGSDDRGGTHAMLWRSVDDGRTWRVAWRDASQPGRRRLHAALPLGGMVLLFGAHKTDAGMLPLRYRWSAGEMRATPALLPGLGRDVDSAVLDAHTGVVWEAGGAVQPAWALADDGDGAVRRWPLGLGADEALVDAWLLCAGDLLLLTRRAAPGGWRHRVLRTHDLVALEPVLTWTADMPLSQLAWWGGGLVFGGGGHALWRSAPPEGG